YPCSPAAAPTQLHTLCLHDALPISHTIHGSAGEAIVRVALSASHGYMGASERELGRSIVVELRASPLSGGMASSASSGKEGRPRDRKSTRLNSSHVSISYAVFCLKK